MRCWGRSPMTWCHCCVTRYVAWPIERIHAWIKYFRDVASVVASTRVQTPRSSSAGSISMGLQRQLKVLGIFARLYHRDGKSGYLKDLPRTLSYVRQVVKNYSDLDFLTGFIEQRIVPAMAKL